MTPFRHLKAVVFDWAGTIVDFGCLAPMGVFVEVFASFGVRSRSTRRAADGAAETGSTSRRWARTRGSPPPGGRRQGSEFDDAAAQRVYEVFVPPTAASSPVTAS